MQSYLKSADAEFQSSPSRSFLPPESIVCIKRAIRICPSAI